jgi:hypothetical protein
MTWRSMMDSMHSRYILYTVCSMDKRALFTKRTIEEFPMEWVT